MEILDFLKGSSIGVYFFIFFGKILEVTISTLRMVLINRGERIKGSIIAFFEVVLWVVITGTVLDGFTKDLIKVLIFCIAFAIGNFIGSWLESKIALGLCTIQVITSENGGQGLSEALRDNGLAVTVTEGEGKEGAKKILMIHLKRSRIAWAVKLIRKLSEDSVITVSDLKVIRGGYIKK